MLSCPECPVGINHTKPEDHHFFSEELLQKILDEVGASLLTIIFHFQGEPLLNKRLPALVSMAHGRGIYTMLSTNAQLLTQEYARQLVGSGLDRIIVSIDGFTEQTYNQYRVGGSLQKALDGLKFLRQAKDNSNADITIELQCLRLKSNESQWKWLRNNYKNLGADCLTLKTAQFYNYRNGNPLMPSDKRYNRYRRNRDGVYERRKPYHRRCLRLWSGCVIDAKGNVLPCCFDKQGKYVFGNLNDKSFRDIWFGSKANAFRRDILVKRSKIDICRNCTE